MKKADVGLIGLAVMGANLARNMADKKFRVSVYNRTSQKTDAFLREFGNEYLTGEKTLEDFVRSLARPRKIFLMVKAGTAVDAVIEQLLPLLEPEDVIIDCGNSLYTDTIRREKILAEKGFSFFGCGVSGGEEGALHGPSLMPGGKKKTWEHLEPVLKAIAAKDFQGKPCVSYLGENGAGHYVKMVHNGIEYAVMQMMAEAYEILTRGYTLSPPEIADIFEGFHRGRLESFLFEITLPILRKKDEFSKGYLIDTILDTAGQKGTGRWTAIEGLERGVDISTITQAVFARVSSSNKEQRKILAEKYTSASPEIALPPQKKFIPMLENALYAGMLVAYKQGFDLLVRAGAEQKWDFDFSEIVRIWQGGCIIRARILQELHRAFLQEKKTDLLQVGSIQKDIQKAWPDFRLVISAVTAQGIPVFCLGAALTSLESMTQSRTSANFIQALRDGFGAHTYERIDREGIFHTDWLDSSSS